MSGTNTLSGPMTPAAPSANNPLTAWQQPAPLPGGGAQGPNFHAQAGQALSGLNLSPEDLQHEAKLSTYGAEEFAKLVKNPDVTRKDVVKAAAKSVADAGAKPENVIQMLSTMPMDDKHLKPWLQERYMTGLTAAVHLKAMLLQQGLPLPEDKKAKKV